MTAPKPEFDYLTRLRKLAASASMRQAIVISTIFTLTTILATAVAFVILSNGLRGRLERDARQMAENLAVTYEIAGLPELKSQIASNAATTRDFTNLFLFVDNTKSIVFGNFNLNAPFEGLRPLVLGRDIILPNTALGDETVTYLAYGIRIRAGWIITARDMRWIGDTREFVLQSVSWGLGSALLLSIILAVAVARRNERRLSVLSRVLDRVAGGELTARYSDTANRGDDINRIAESINKTLDRLNLTVDSLRQVSNDIAHDLRTPLTRLRGRLEPLLNRTDLPEDAIEAVALAEAQLNTVGKTFDAILRIAQIEGANRQPEQTPVDAAAICRDVHEMLAPVAEEMGHHLELEPGDDAVLVRVDRDILAQALVNLVENSLRHCPAPARISLGAAYDGAKACVRVCDDGPGIPEAERANVLRRFYRLEKSRNTEGSGLGLSLVAAIVRLHHGTLTLSDNAPGLCVRMIFPVASSPR